MAALVAAAHGCVVNAHAHETDLSAARRCGETTLFNAGTFVRVPVLVRAVLPQFRERRAGVVINVTSTVTLRPLHLLSIYTASKAAVNAFTESLALELAPFGVRARLARRAWPPRPPSATTLAPAWA